MRNKIYKIRNKKTQEFITLGYSNKYTWHVFPSEAIKNNKHIICLDDYEVVVFEYKEINILPLIKK